MEKPRLLIPMSLQFSVRYLLRTGILSQLGAFAQPVVLLGWEDRELEDELRREGCEVHPLLKSRWGTAYERTRSLVNFWYLGLLRSPTRAIKERRANVSRPLPAMVRSKMRKAARHVLLDLPGSVRRIREAEAARFWSDTNAREVERQIQELRIDAALSVTPFLYDEEMALRVCAQLGITTCTAVLSFDNLTTRAWIPITFQHYLLWNRYNAEHLLRGYPEAGSSRITIVGSPQFDFYWDRNYIWDEGTWRRRLSLPPDKRVILFGGGHVGCAPHEPIFLTQLDDAIERNEIPRDTVILFRRHPVDPLDRWEPVLREAKHVVHDDPWRFGPSVLGHTNVRHEDIAKLASTLYHCQAHVNVASTMTVDGAIFDRPQIGPAYDDSPDRKWDRTARECYMQEHYLPITFSGGLDLVRSRRQLVTSVCSALEDPGRMAEGRKRLAREICTYADGKCTGRVIAAIRTFLGQTLSRPAMEEARLPSSLPR